MSKPRHVRGLQKVDLCAHGPYAEPRLKGAAAEGLRFQKRVGKLLLPYAPQGTLYLSHWFRYSDRYGTHWAQPDLMLDVHDRVVLGEVKLSLRRQQVGLTQLTKCYRQLCEAYFQKPVIMVLIFHHFIRDIQDELEMIDEPEHLLTVPVRSAAKPLGWHIL